jgi:hypothetical protein
MASPDLTGYIAEAPKADAYRSASAVSPAGVVNRIWLIVLVVASFASILMTARAIPAAQPIEIDLTQWAPPDVGTVGDDPFGKLVKYGHTLFADTANEVGPAVSDP